MKKNRLAAFLLAIVSIQFVHATTLKADYKNDDYGIKKHESLSLKDDSALLNKRAPNFQLRGLKGELYSLSSLKGKIIVLNFWFVNCKPCVNEMPVLNSLMGKYDPEKVVFLALSLDTKSVIDTFLKSHQFDYIILPESKSAALAFGIYAYPASLVIDENGIVRFIQIGGPNINENLSQAINVTLKRS